MNLDSSTHFSPKMGDWKTQQIENILCGGKQQAAWRHENFSDLGGGIWGQPGPPTASHLGPLLAMDSSAYWAPGLPQDSCFCVSWMEWEERKTVLAGGEKALSLPRSFWPLVLKTSFCLSFSWISPVGTDHRKEMGGYSLLLIVLLFIWYKCSLDQQSKLVFWHLKKPNK